MDKEISAIVLAQIIFKTNKFNFSYNEEDHEWHCEIYVTMSVEELMPLQEIFTNYLIGIGVQTSFNYRFD